MSGEKTKQDNTEFKDDQDRHDHHVHGPHCQHDHHHSHFVTAPIRRDGPKLGRNDPCYCGSGKKFKKCHGG